MKAYTDMTVTEFINDLRLNYIANMLQNSNHTVTEIIFDSGFNNISWAARLFKEKYGESMRQYRKNSWSKQ
jgi:AraC-like DNA-binding protein